MFQNGGCECVVAVVIHLMAAGDVRIAFLERNEIAKFEIFNAGMAVAADYGQRALRLNINLMVERSREAGTKSVGTRVVVKRTGTFRGHTCYHLLKVTTGWLMLLNLRRKSNSKRKLADLSRRGSVLV